MFTTNKYTMQGEERRNREWPKTKGKNVGKQNQKQQPVFSSLWHGIGGEKGSQVRGYTSRARENGEARMNLPESPRVGRKRRGRDVVPPSSRPPGLVNRIPHSVRFSCAVGQRLFERNY